MLLLRKVSILHQHNGRHYSVASHKTFTLYTHFYLPKKYESPVVTERLVRKLLRIDETVTNNRFKWGTEFGGNVLCEELFW